MKKLLGVGLPVLALGTLIALMVIASQGVSMPVVDTKGFIGNSQRDILRSEEHTSELQSH